jgi:diketogulonate reductase-like aldo/keto reductase
MNTVKTLDLPAGPAMPVLGLGTWRLGEDPARRPAEVAAVRAALRMGYRLIDTAEMYGDGGSEEVVGQAIAEAIAAGEVRRDALYVVSKVLPHNASRRGTSSACARSLARLGLERLDLYLLHWRGPHRLADTVAALEALVAEGRIGAWGVSNFDTDDMDELAALPGGGHCVADQVYYRSPSAAPDSAWRPGCARMARP